MQRKRCLTIGTASLSVLIAALMLGICAVCLAQKSKPQPPPTPHDKIAFSREVLTRWGRTNVPSQQIFTMYTDGTGLKQITFMNSGPGYPWRTCPRWLPDGRIAFVQKSAAVTYDVYMSNADGSGLTRVTPSSAYGMNSLSVSRDGAFVAYSACAAGSPYEIRVTPILGGTPATVFTAPSGANLHVGNWSPDLDGNPVNGYQGMLLFGHTGNGTPPVILKAVGVQIVDGLFSVTSAPVDVLDDAECGEWSPDGSRISVSLSSMGGDCAIDVQYIGTQPQFPLYAADAYLVAPGALGGTAHWSPDGTQMTYASGADIYRIVVGSGQPVAMTRTSAWEGVPDWSPPVF